MPDVTAEGKEVLTSVPGFRGLGLWLLSLAFFRERGGWSLWQRAAITFLVGGKQSPRGGHCKLYFPGPLLPPIRPRLLPFTAFIWVTDGESNSLEMPSVPTQGCSTHPPSSLPLRFFFFFKNHFVFIIMYVHMHLCLWRIRRGCWIP